MSNTNNNKPPHPTPLKVAIIGAGPAGCTLALLLLRANINIAVTVFERESSPTVRGQGGTLDLHKDTGLRAIHALGLYPQFERLARFDGDSLQLFDKRKTRYVNLSSSNKKGALFAQGKPEIDRSALRKLLLEALPEGIVRWGSKFLGIGEESEGVELRFEHGVERGFDLVVGADGSSSRVRNAVMETKTCFSNVGGFTMSTGTDVEEKHPEAYKLVRRGSVFVFGDGKEVIGQQMGDGSISVTVWLRKAEDGWMESCGFDVRDGEAVIMGLCKEFEGWHPDLVALLHAVDPATVEARSLFHLPIGERWKTKPGITLIGDAAHVMTPFAGEGVNAALRDALDLANCITLELNKKSKIKEVLMAVGKSENEMITRVNKAQLMTEDMKNLMMFTEGAPRSVIEGWIIRSMSDDLNIVLLTGVRVAVYLYFFLFKLFNRNK